MSRDPTHPSVRAGSKVTDPTRLEALRDLELLDSARDKAFDRLTLLAAVTLDAPMAAVTFVEADRQFLKSSVGMPREVERTRQTGLDVSFCRHVVERDEPFVIRDTRLTPAEGTAPVAGTRSYAGFPLTDPGGQVLGAFCVMDRIPRQWSDRELAFLETLTASVVSEIALHAARLRERRRSEQLESLVSERTASLERANRFLLGAWKDLSRSREETIWRLSGAIAARSGETGAHANRMSLTCALLAERIGIDRPTAELIRIASPLHDVGKIAIPDVVLNKPGPLTAAERAIIETHAPIGHRMLSGSQEPLLELAAVMALSHHERMDGRGYPGRLVGDDIPIEGRIAAVADVFDALTNDRPYRPAFTLQEALAMMQVERGAQFDPLVLDALSDGLDEILARLETGDTPRAADPQGPAPRPTGDR